MRRFLAGSALVLLFSACDHAMIPERPSELPDGFRYATASASCGPADEGVVEILMSDVAGSPTEGISTAERPLLWLQLFPTGAVTAGQQYNWPADRGTLRATVNRCIGDGPCELATGAAVIMQTSLPDTLVLGSLTAGFADGSVISGAIRARWVPRRVICG